MMRRFLLTSFIVASTVASSSAQQPAPAPTASVAAPTAPESAQPPAPAPEVQGFAYTADGRRDPFISLLRGGGETQRSPGSRAPGLAGLAVSEVVLKGTVATQGGFVAIVQGADNRTYTVRAGNKLFDGVVRGISQDTMVLLQHVNDPLSLEKEREVRKQLRQTEEVK